MGMEIIQWLQLAVAFVALVVSSGITTWRLLKTSRKELDDKIDGVGVSLNTKIDTLTSDMATVNGRLAHIEGWIQGRFNDGAK